MRKYRHNYTGIQWDLQEGWRRLWRRGGEQAGIFSIFDKSSSFDRLFPNQDFLSGKRLWQFKIC
jgi:muconolactone delta-isomerase